MRKNIKKKFYNYFLLKRFNKSFRNDAYPDPDLDPDPFFSSKDPGSGSALKLNVS